MAKNTFPTGEIKEVLKLNGIIVCNDTPKTRASFPLAEPVRMQYPTQVEATHGVAAREVVEAEAVPAKKKAKKKSKKKVAVNKIEKHSANSPVDEAVADEHFDNLFD